MTTTKSILKAIIAIAVVEIRTLYDESIDTVSPMAAASGSCIGVAEECEDGQRPICSECRRNARGREKGPAGTI